QLELGRAIGQLADGSLDHLVRDLPLRHLDRNVVVVRYGQDRPHLEAGLEGQRAAVLVFDLVKDGVIDRLELLLLEGPHRVFADHAPDHLVADFLTEAPAYDVDRNLTRPETGDA